MIAKIRSGSRAAGLMYYLLGPGSHEEHVDPMVIGSWDGHPERLAGLSPGEIGRLLEVPLAIQGLDGSKMVWHTSLRNHADDRVLSNEEWVEVARDVLDRTGISPRGDDGAARWVVVRHDRDHVHLAAVLARQDTGARIWPRRDYVRAREACVAAEARLGLVATNRNGHGRPGRSRPEEERVRDGGVDLRGRLRRAAEVAAAEASGPDEFLEHLRVQGVMVETRVGDDGTVTGYRVAVAEADPVWFGGSKLHRSLSWPQLERSWDEGSAGTVARGRAAGVGDDELLGDLERVIGEVVGEGSIEDLAGTDIPQATGAVLRAAADRVDGRFETDLTLGVDEYLRAVTEDRSTSLRVTRSGLELRAIAAAMLLVDRRRDTAQRAIIAALLLVEATARLRESQNRLAQAQAASRAAAMIGQHGAVAANEAGGQRGPVSGRQVGATPKRRPGRDSVSQPSKRRPRGPSRGPQAS